MQVYSDSQLVMDQCQGIYEAKETTMQLYLQKILLHLRNENRKISVTCISRDDTQ
jgi:ribonuclease HI